jgi:hypothetical protein
MTSTIRDFSVISSDRSGGYDGSVGFVGTELLHCIQNDIIHACLTSYFTHFAGNSSVVHSGLRVIEMK